MKNKLQILLVCLNRKINNFKIFIIHFPIDKFLRLFKTTLIRPQSKNP